MDGYTVMPERFGCVGYLGISHL
ncbi:hypothetical protein AGR1C_pAt40292 [Agrobacterium fabacearum TT111]|nr:hypothetical protein AGR1C_pAt40292 [Agrobacterium fabacearum TT111]